MSGIDLRILHTMWQSLPTTVEAHVKLDLGYARQSRIRTKP